MGPEEATRGRNGIRAKPQREPRNEGPPHRVRRCGPQPKWTPQKKPEEARTSQKRPEFTRNHNATKFVRNHSGSVETKAPSHRARRCGRQPKWPPQKRPEEATTGRNSRETTETQRNSRETTAGASKPRPRPTARAVVVGNLSGPPRRGCRGLNSRETTGGASKCNRIRAKPQREHRNATEFARNHSGSVETKARCGQQPIPLP